MPHVRSAAGPEPEVRTIRVAHSPDADDAFMFCALAEGRIDTGDLRFEHELQDIQTLNERALRGELEVTAVSIHAYAHLADRYLLLPHGASMGEGYGPRLVARRRLEERALRRATIAVPGELTSAYLALKLWEPSIRTVARPFDRILEEVAEGRHEAGLLIHEGQLTYADAGLHLLLDLGEWWNGETGLPLPLGGNVVRRDLGPDLVRRISSCLRESIAWALEHREEALRHAMRYARDLPIETAEEFIGLYVNRRTLDYGEAGREAVRLFLARGGEAGLVPQVRVEFAD